MTTIENAVTRVGPGTAQKGHRNKNSAANITQLPTPQRVRSGILGYRQQRIPDEVIRCLTEALRREIHVSDELGIPVSNQTLRDIIAWGERGAIPS